ncbi:hypothetical protein [Streptomyces sp. NPDC047000]|uniref:hypothetical protein n=1 Tax=Streptomyces sp. NPDC047000 TaxID=3155474 RepID=UPI0033FDDFA9
MLRSATKRGLRAAVVCGVLLTALASPLAHAADHNPGTLTDADAGIAAGAGPHTGAGTDITNITDINNHNIYSFQGLGTLTVTDLLSLLGLQP